jgi:anti-sigma factor RsiW
MSAHVGDLLALAAAGALDAAEDARVLAHLRDCPACAADAAEWRRLTDDLRRLPPARASRALVVRTVGAVEKAVAGRAERAWNQAALGFVLAFAWTLSVLAWFFLELVTGELALKLGHPLGPTAAWYAGYVGAGWLTAGAAVVLLGRSGRREGRTV